MNKKGFTLIELLVVIAIIAILSAVAVVYLTDARTKAQDAAVASNISTASTQLELDRIASTTFAVNGDIASIITKLGAYPCAAGKTGWTAIGNSDSSSVAFYAQNCSNSSYFCADTNGFRGSSTLAALNGACR